MARELVTDPIYKQVSDMLLELVHTEYEPGDQFLTERQISERFDISRTTANKALANLVVDGVLEFRKGVGTFVAHPKLNVDLKRLVSFTEKARAAGYRPETSTKSFRLTTIGELKLLPALDVAALFDCEPDTPAYEMERVRAVDGEPVVYERRALLADPCPGLTAEQVAGSLYTVFAGSYDLRLEGVAQRIRARNLSASEAKILRMKQGEAVLELTGVGHIAGGQPLWYEETLYRGDAYEFVNQVVATGDENQSTVSNVVQISEEDANRAWYRWNTDRKGS
ncbi:MAG: GntR family transcriptional regulator [Spirochaetota bacterium]